MEIRVRKIPGVCGKDVPFCGNSGGIEMHVDTRMALFCALFVAKSNASQAETLIGKVVGVTDGDTITVLNGQQTQHKIRLMGIDCPYMQVNAIRSR